MTKWILGAVAIVALLLPTAAQAEPFTPELEADYVAALAWWGVSSPPQCASVTRELLPADVDAADGIEASARATQPRPYERKVRCTLTVYANHLFTGCIEEAAIRHEVGHLLGLGHSADPANVMYFEVNPAWCPTPDAVPMTAPPPPLPALTRPHRQAKEHPTKRKRCRHAGRVGCARAA